MKIQTKSIKETEKVAKEFVESVIQNKNLDSAFIVALYGDLGSGKTTFVKAVAKAFGLKNTVTSPTFVIEKIYRLDNQNFDHLIHIDAYRLESGDELKHLGWEEISKNSKNIIFIEWPDNVEEILPSNMKKIEFKFVDENTRQITFLNKE